MDFEELELQLMPAMQRVVQQAATKQAAVQETIKMMEAVDFVPPIKDYPGEVAQVQLVPEPENQYIWEVNRHFTASKNHNPILQW